MVSVVREPRSRCWVTHVRVRKRASQPCTGLGERALAVLADATDPDSVEDARQEIERAFGPVDVLVNINLSSASSGPPVSLALTYSVAKAGLDNLTRYLACELAPTTSASTPSRRASSRRSRTASCSMTSGCEPSWSIRPLGDWRSPRSWWSQRSGWHRRRHPGSSPARSSMSMAASPR